MNSSLPLWKNEKILLVGILITISVIVIVCRFDNIVAISRPVESKRDIFDSLSQSNRSNECEMIVDVNEFALTTDLSANQSANTAPQPNQILCNEMKNKSEVSSENRPAAVVDFENVKFVLNSSEEYKSNAIDNEDIKINQNKINDNRNNKQNKIYKDSVTKFGYKVVPEKAKSRKKRSYLVFPEGSSLQASYCAYIYYPGWENYGLYGLTVALAWQLPTKPPSEQIEAIDNVINNYTSTYNHHESSESPPASSSAPLSTDTTTPPSTVALNRMDFINNIKYFDTKSKYFNENQHQQFNQHHHYDADNDNNASFLPSRRKKPAATYAASDTSGANRFNHTVGWQNYNVGNNTILRDYVSSYNRQPTANGYWQGHNYWLGPYTNENAMFKNSPWMMPPPKHRGSSILTNDNYRKNNQFADKSSTSGDSVSNKNRSKATTKQQSREKKPTTKKYKKPLMVPPVFGKRKKRDTSIPEYDKYDLIDIHYHRTSRQVLYENLEKFLDHTGQNGTACILKSLCEIGQREEDTEAVELFREVLRTVFTLPQPIYEETNEKYQGYDAAHSYEGDCNAKYPECPTSVWAE